MVYPLNNHLFFWIALLAAVLMIALMLVIIGFPESFRHLLFPGKKYFSMTSHDQPSTRRTEREKRAETRFPLSQTLVNVTDGYIFCTALLENISARGVCLNNLPETLYRNSENLTLFSQASDGLPVLHVRPQWERKEKSGKRIGAKILNNSEKWVSFLKRYHPMQ